MKPKAVVFFDLDGTLLNEHAKLDEETIQIIKQLKENNILPVIATGRTNVEIQNIIDISGIDVVATMNGQLIINQEKIIYEDLIDKKNCDKLLQFTEENNDSLGFYNQHEIIVSEENEAVVKCFDYLDSNYTHLSHSYGDVNMMIIYRLPSADESKYEEKFQELSFYRNTPYSIDVVRKGVSKRTAVEMIINKLSLHDVKSIAFGDGLNDIPMFEVVDYSVAMENASELVKSKADYITDKNTNGGILKGLQHLGLI